MSTRSSLSRLPVAIVGAGPVGLAAAAQLAIRNEPFVLLEAGPAAGAAVAAWGHVKVFSPWRYNIDRAARALLEETTWSEPNPEACPTGRELIDAYLAPLAAHPAIAPHLRTGTRVVRIGRDGLDKMKNGDRAASPFALQIERGEGEIDTLLARAVIDASGTWDIPNPLGANGLPVPGEHALRDRISYGIPDVLGPARADVAGSRVLVVGSGHSAFNVLIDLARLAKEAPGTEIHWAIRQRAGRAFAGQVFGGETSDALPERGSLGKRIRQLTQSGQITLHTGVRITQLRATESGIAVQTSGLPLATALPEVDRIVTVTGFRPDLAMLRELRLDLDPAVESPTALAPLIDPNLHSCGTVPPHGAEHLGHPEPNFYIAGMKSYGRAPTFLMMTGYEQVRSIVCALTGDLEGARNVELTLPTTGVCSSDLAGPATESDAGCCGTVAESTAIADATGCCDDPAGSPDSCCGGRVATPVASELVQIVPGGRRELTNAGAPGRGCC
ncbi:MAG: FAD-dependent oxidoreductase [Chloroflexia bacterium]|nr:FAD-dependent oxidoreductase [Chloroflexia bacterium]